MSGMTRRRSSILAALTALGIASVVATSLSAAAAGPSSAAGSLPALAGVNFVSVCGYSRRAPDDPIVFPGQPGASHDHSFVGNVSTNAFSTLATLRAAMTTCRRPGDTAGYWMPTLFVDNQPAVPAQATIYYRRSTLAQPRAFPAGLKIVAGNSHAFDAQDTRIVFWNCGVTGGVARSTTPPTCANTGAQSLRLHVTFPSCWDGKHLDSLDHKSHMAYPTAGVCPADHPVPTPAITIIYRYATVGGPLTALATHSATAAGVADRLAYVTWSPSTPGSASGSFGSIRSSASTRSVATASAFTQLRSAGTTYQGAQSVDVSVIASSQAAT
jgi:hypothetical protein